MRNWLTELVKPLEYCLASVLHSADGILSPFAHKYAFVVCNCKKLYP